ncbi:MAG: hypothetical protein ACU84Q_01600 [Gammaproteobacteria bacterium]
MSSLNFLQDNPAKLITCIVPAGDGLKLVERLYETHDLTGINTTHGRGASQRSSTIADEMDIVTVTVSSADADDIFAFIYETIEIETKPHRFMFQTALDMASVYTLPDLPQPETE